MRRVRPGKEGPQEDPNKKKRLGQIPLGLPLHKATANAFPSRDLSFPACIRAHVTQTPLLLVLAGPGFSCPAQ